MKNKKLIIALTLLGLLAGIATYVMAKKSMYKEIPYDVEEHFAKIEAGEVEKVELDYCFRRTSFLKDITDEKLSVTF